MPSPETPPNRPHTPAALLALTVVMAFVLAVPGLLSTLGKQGLHKLLTEQNTQKDMGRLLQRMAFSDPKILPVYGSSELTRVEPNRADKFFESAPTGFRVCPVGAAGNTTFMIAQKIAAQGGRVRNHKLVVLLSTSWFRRPQVPPDHYRGTFSVAQATEIMVSNQLDHDIRRRFAQRMLDYPETLKDQPALSARVHQVADSGAGSYFRSLAQRPMLHLQHTSLGVEDNLGTIMSLTGAGKPSSNEELPVAVVPFPTPFSWDPILKESDTYALPPFGKPAPEKDYARTDAEGSRNKSFIAGFDVDHNKEWTDFELLLDTLKNLDAKPLIIAIPLDGQYEGAHGTDLEGRNFYYGRLEKMCTARGIAFTHLAEHDQDKLFVVEHSSHVTGKGWLYLNHVFDEFYHDRLGAAAGSKDS